jgi:hypothetical protein
VKRLFDHLRESVEEEEIQTELVFVMIMCVHILVTLCGVCACVADSQTKFTVLIPIMHEVLCRQTLVKVTICFNYVLYCKLGNMYLCIRMYVTREIILC